MRIAAAIVNAYDSREESKELLEDGMAEWARRNPELNELLEAAMLQAKRKG